MRSTTRRGFTLLAHPAIRPMFLILFLAVPALSLRLAPNRYEGGRSKDVAEIEARNSSSFAIILGEVRSNLSDLMFIKTERYLHNGVAYLPHIDMEEAARSGEITAKGAPGKSDTPKSMQFAQEFEAHQREVEGAEGEEEHEEHALQTVIKTREQDFRGFIGDLQRQVKPWRDPSLPDVHTDGTELLPWYRLMTLSDPHNIRAYMIGAWWLKHQKQEKFNREALKFLDEGIRYNPDAFQLPLMKGYVFNEMNDRQSARLAFMAAAEIAVRIRPKGWTPESRKTSQAAESARENLLRPSALLVWTDYQEDDARAAVRLAVIAERDAGNLQSAIEMARRYNNAIGGDGRLEALLRQMAGELKNWP